VQLKQQAEKKVLLNVICDIKIPEYLDILYEDFRSTSKMSMLITVKVLLE
jgi:hypothetical protein